MWRLAVFFLIIIADDCYGSAEVIQMGVVRCKVLDPEQITVSACVTRAISRGITETTFRALLLKRITNITVSIKLMKKSSRYNSYFAEQKFDGCLFMTQHHLNPIANNLYKMMEPYTNINHTCPYDGEIIVAKYHIDPRKFAWLPIPDGSYAFYISWIVAGKPMLDTNVYFTFKER